MKWNIEKIQKRLEKDGHKNIDPRHVAGFMEFGIKSWGNCTDIEFNREYKISVECVQQSTFEDSESNAVSFGY